ncbi:MAG: hypothetical protein OSJ36_09750 [Odoribacter sp.]|nr:hypothetical protein [Odoribacter sp.]
MKNYGIRQIHIIPFDIGCMFFDCLSLNNSKNLHFAKKFIEKLTIECAAHNITVSNNIELTYAGKNITGVTFGKNEIADQAVCIAKLNDCLSCYVLANGIGIFVLADFEGKAFVNTDESISKYSKALIANYQKKIAQATILNRFNGDDVMPEEEKLMLTFREICWKLVSEGAKKREILHVRKFSGTKSYKSDGLSYVLTVYLLNQKDFTENEMNHLMCSTVFHKVADPENWEEINNVVMKTEAEDKPAVLQIGEDLSYYSWSAVAVSTKDYFASYEDALKNTLVANLLKAELYVQSRWLIADNSMDNVNKNSHYTMESLQRLLSYIEFSQAELENDISANMHTLYKKVLTQVVVSSEVKQLYKSVLSQINTQKKIKEAIYQDKKRKNKLIMDLFLAIFSASSLYKTVNDLINQTFSWVNWVIFGAMMLVAVGTILFNYKNK